MKNSQLVIPVKLRVEIEFGVQYEVKGTYNGYEFDQVYVKRASKSRAYFIAVRNNMRMCEIPKQMKFEKGQTFVKFGNQKIVIGTYTEVFGE